MSQANYEGENAARHVPVMLQEVMFHLGPEAGKTIVDGTFGAGGYSNAFLKAGAKVIAFDRDPSAISAGQAAVAKSNGHLTLIEDTFSALKDHVHAPVEGLVLDIGVSSMQFDEAERGFSFRFDGPLDMRMSKQGQSAADIVNSYGETELANLIYKYGEEKKSRYAAKAIVERRKIEPFTRTLDLAQVLEKAIFHKATDIHPATRTFQALRIAVNDELGELEAALNASLTLLKPKGRLVVVTFHSLEDRIVKDFMQTHSSTQQNSRHLPSIQIKQAMFTLPSRRAIAPSDAETKVNPRARSAKLRVAERI
jgi:16S rRNA (cytosine1402-N4)-methyltransferase